MYLVVIKIAFGTKIAISAPGSAGSAQREISCGQTAKGATMDFGKFSRRALLQGSAALTLARRCGRTARRAGRNHDRSSAPEPT